MAAKPTVAEINAAIETDLDSSRLQDLIDAEEADVVLRFGDHTSESDDLAGGSPLVFPSRAISSVTSIAEVVGNAEFTLAADDYAIRAGGRWLERKADGTNGRSLWGDRVRIAYVPVDGSARRKRVIVDLVVLAIKNNGLAMERSGDHYAVAREYQLEREAILSGLATGGVRFFA